MIRSAASNQFPNYSGLIPVPDGAYLGAAVNPNQGQDLETQTEQLESQTMHRALNMHLHYWSFGDFNSSVLNTTITPELNADWQYGRIPVISLGCKGEKHLANFQSTDQAIQAVSSALSAYNHPVLLRFFWEFTDNLDEHSGPTPSPSPSATPNPYWPYPQAAQNNNEDCVDTSIDQAAQETNFISAWNALYTGIRGADGSKNKNVNFLWNPDSGGVPSAPFYPGSSTVDWVGWDSYDKSGTGFDSVMSLYSKLDTYGKPIALGETGECQGAATSQSTYLSEAQTEMPGSYPHLKAFIYFDSGGGVDKCNWYFNSDGLNGIYAMGQSPYFGGVREIAQSSVNGTGSSYTLSGKIPVNATAFVYLSIAEPASPGVSITVPSGWTLVGNARYDDFNSAAQVLYEHTGTTTEPAQYTWSWTSSSPRALPYGATAVTFTGVNLTGPIDVDSGFTRTKGQNAATTALTPSAGGEYELAFFNGYYPAQTSGTNVSIGSTWSLLGTPAQGAYANIFTQYNPLGQAAPFSASLQWPTTAGYYTVERGLALRPASTNP